MTPSQISSKRKPALFFLCAFSVLIFPPTLTLSIATTGSELQNYKEAWSSRQNFSSYFTFKFLQGASFKKHVLNPFLLITLLILRKFSLCSSTWNETPYVVNVVPKYMIMLPQLPRSEDCRHVPTCLKFLYHIFCTWKFTQDVLSL